MNPAAAQQWRDDMLPSIRHSRSKGNRGNAHNCARCTWGGRPMLCIFRMWCFGCGICVTFHRTKRHIRAIYPCSHYVESAVAFFVVDFPGVAVDLVLRERNVVVSCWECRGCLSVRCCCVRARVALSVMVESGGKRAQVSMC